MSENRKNNNNSGDFFEGILLIGLIAAVICLPIGIIILILKYKNNKKFGPKISIVLIIISYIMFAVGIISFFIEIVNGYDSSGLISLYIIPTCICFGLGKSIEEAHKKYKKYVEIIINNHEYHIDKLSRIMRCSYTETVKDIEIMIKK